MGSNRGKVYQYEVEQIPLVESITKFSIGDRKRYGLMTTTGIGNAYRIAFALGQGASTKDRTWSKSEHIHTCCGSRVGWRHKTCCNLLKFDDEFAQPQSTKQESR